MAKFRKKPVVIEATQWFKNGDHPEDYANEKEGFENGEFRTWTGEEVRANGWEGQVVRYFRRPDVSGDTRCRNNCGHIMHDHGWIGTKEGGHIVCPGDWIITGVQGERYPCKPDIFKATYEDIREAKNPMAPGTSVRMTKASLNRTDLAYTIQSHEEHQGLLLYRLKECEGGLFLPSSIEVF